MCRPTYHCIARVTLPDDSASLRKSCSLKSIVSKTVSGVEAYVYPAYALMQFRCATGIVLDHAAT